MWYNRSYSLAFCDGPYNMLLPSTFFRRNPGLPVQNVTIGFQPEIGSVGMPTYRGLLRFMHPSDVESGFPRRNQSDTENNVWKFHKFEPWTTLLDNNETYDHVYAYFEDNYDVNGSDWVAAAQLALHVQYQNLFNGFISHVFEYTTAVIMWKTQSPWPSLRGFLYDWYLETTGALRGVRASLSSPVSVVFDPLSWRLRIINRSIQSFLRSFCLLGAEYRWIDVQGNIVESKEVMLLHDISAMSASFLGSIDDVLQWPENCSSVCFLQLQQTGNCSIEQTNQWYWLTKPSTNGDASDFSLLGQLRQNRSASVQVQVHHCHVSGKGLQVQASIQVALDSPVILFYPTFQLLKQNNDSLLPLFDDHECDIALIPGSDSIRTLESPVQIEAGSRIRVGVSSWNAPTMYHEIFCQEPIANNEII
jgi:mannosylglycoprotein endo-beta-mannosidase